MPHNVPIERESVWSATLTSAERDELQVDSSSRLVPNPDVLVLGGSLVGLATAYFAAEQGLRVLVLSDELRLGADAELSLGCVIPNACAWQFSELTKPLAQISRDWWAKLAVRPEFQLDWRVSGALMVDAGRLLPSARQQMLTGLEAGYSLHDVDAEQIRLLEPALAHCPTGGLHYPSEAVIHPLRAVLGFARGLRRKGGQIVCGSVTGSVMSSHHASSFETTIGSIQPKATFIGDSSFLNNNSLAGIAPAGLVRSERVFLASAPQPPLLKHPILDVNWIVQLKSGEVVMEVEPTDDGAVDEALHSARQLVPALATVEFVRHWSGTSRRSPNRTPIVDRLQMAQNAWYCDALDFGSILFGPVIGKAVADWIVSGQPMDELSAFAAR